MRRPKPLSVEEVCAGTHRIAILENVVNPTNVGAIFRSAAALNMDAVLLTPDCSDPLYRRSDPRQHGNGIPDSMDLFSGRRIMAGRREGNF